MKFFLHGLNRFEIAVASLLFFASSLCAENAPSPAPLWENGAPGAKGSAPKDTPTITPYLLPKTDTLRPAIILCPGGGYAGLSHYEGKGHAEFFNSLGFDSFVLHYRLPKHEGYQYPIPLQDAQRAMQWVRARATEFGIDPEKIGVGGSSAGGHLAGLLATAADAADAAAPDPISRLSSKPNFLVLSFPVVTMTTQFTHEKSRDRLIGAAPTEELVTETSVEKRVAPSTPPAFVWHGKNDKIVSFNNSVLFADACKEKGVPVEIQLYEDASHGSLFSGTGDPSKAEWDSSQPLNPWAEALVAWLKSRQLVR